MHEQSKAILLVTGGSRGIGRATSLLAAQRGYRVVVNYAQSAAAAKAVVDEIRAGGGDADALQADIGSETEIRLMFAAIARDIGALTCLVNNAGIVEENSPGARISTDRFDRMLRVNLRGAFLCIQEAAERIARNPNGGAIVNVSSYSVRTGGAFHHIDYAAAKAGVEAMTLGFARELAAANIRVNAVAPGTIDTEMSERTVGKKRDRVEERIPMRRFGTADEIAETVLWLLSPSASYVTGSIVAVNGGR